MDVERLGQLLERVLGGELDVRVLERLLPGARPQPVDAEAPRERGQPGPERLNRLRGFRAMPISQYGKYIIIS